MHATGVVHCNKAKSEICVGKACRRKAKWEERVISLGIVAAPVLVSGAFCYYFGGMPTNLPWLMGIPLADSQVPPYLVF